jgi:choice-of-anchor B domain-containing protein
MTARSNCARRAALLALAPLLLALGSAGLNPSPADEGGCDAVPRGMVLQPEQLLRLDDKAVRVSVRKLPAGGHMSVPYLEVDLVPEYMIDGTRRPRVGSYIPHLAVDYRLTTPGGTTLAAGGFPLTMSHLGHTYGGVVPLDGMDSMIMGQEPPLLLTLTLDWKHPETYREACPELPLTLATEIDLATIPDQSAFEASSGVDAPADNIRFDVVAGFDPRPAEASSDIWGYTDGTTFLAIMGKTNGTSFIDITNPAAPVEIGFIGGPGSSWRDIKTYRTYAYITTEGTGAGEGMQIVDLSNPQSPTLVNTYNTTFTSAHNLYIDTAIGEAWIVGSSNNTRILDLSADPVNPTDIGSFDTRYVHDGYVADGFAYLSEINNGLQEVLDSTNPASLQSLSTWTTPGDATHNCWANNDHSLLSTTDETGGGFVAVYDITDKSNPGVKVSEFNPDPTSVVHNVKFDDDDNERIAMSYYALGGILVDLHRPTAPVTLARYDTFPNGDSGFNGAWGVYAFDPRGYYYISDVDTGLYVLDYMPTGGTLSGIVREAGSLQPLPDARVVALADAADTISGSDGVYAMYVSEGNVELRASAWGYRTKVLDVGAMPLDGRLDVDIELERLPRVALSGSVTRSDNLAPIEGVTVTLLGSGLSATTDAAGGYGFAEAAIGQQTLTVEAFGYSSGEGRIVLSDGHAGTLDFSLDPALFADDAEGNQGWSLGVGGDTATEGLWTRVDPNGTGGGNVQPEDDRTPSPGVTAFITGQSNPGSGTEANDVEGGVTTLISPVFDASGESAAQVRFHRWVSANAGILSGGLLRVQISSNGGGSWTQLEAPASPAAWTLREFDLGGFTSLTDQMQVRFRAEAQTQFGNFRVLEAGVDDFDVVRACSSRFNTPAGDADFDGIVDACDACPQDSSNDADGDGVCGDVDNAPFDANAGQADADADGVGDIVDNCGSDFNPDQRDLDGDRLGNACDDDIDGDGTLNASDTDQDGDGVDDASDVCPTTSDSAQSDFDLDGSGDECDRDDGLVQGIRVDANRVSWEPEDGTDDYNVYRGDLGSEGLLPLAACRASGLTALYFDDPELPVPGDGYFYLVTRTSGGGEGGLGTKSDGSPRQITVTCN